MRRDVLPLLLMFFSISLGLGAFINSYRARPVEFFDQSVNLCALQLFMMVTNHSNVSFVVPDFLKKEIWMYIMLLFMRVKSHSSVSTVIPALLKNKT